MASFANVVSDWVDGDLVYYTKDRATEIMRIKGSDGTVTFSATGRLVLAAGEITAADIGTSAVTTAKINAAAVTAAKIANEVLTGAHVDALADDNVVGAIPVLHRVDLAAGANGDTDVTLTHKERVLDFWVILTGAGVASAVYTLKNGANAISDGLDVSGSDTAIVRAATLDDANHEIAAAGTLRITGSGGATQPAATAYVLAARVD